MARRYGMRRKIALLNANVTTIANAVSALNFTSGGHASPCISRRCRPVEYATQGPHFTAPAEHRGANIILR